MPVNRRPSAPSVLLRGFADHGGKKKKDAELFKETLPEAWRPYLAQQNGKSKPLFLFYSSGKLHKTIHGINTPLICETVKGPTHPGPVWLCGAV